MSLVKVQRKGQVTIPASLRSQVGLADGDMVEALAERGRIILTPKTVIDRLRQATEAPPELKAVRNEARRQGSDQLSLRQINAEIAATRRKGRKKKTS